MRVLVIGGTGPSGPHIINGLIRRGHNVTILHGGHHEVEFIEAIEHIHTDPHFDETLRASLAGRSFDLVIATYGRIRVIANVMKGIAGRLITVSGAAVYAAPDDPRWGRLGRPALVTEESPLQDEPHERHALGFKVRQAEREVMRMHAAGHYTGTIFRYPLVYGPNSPANRDWSVVRRILDGRPRFLMADGGQSLLRLGYSANIAHAVLLGADQPQVAGGQIYNVADADVFTVRQRVNLIASALGHSWELVSVPHDLARRTSPLWSHEGHLAFDTSKLRHELGYSDAVAADVAAVESARWLVEHAPPIGGELERQLGDPFDYEAEDALARTMQAAHSTARCIAPPVISSDHMYRHPVKPGEDWKPGVKVS